MTIEEKRQRYQELAHAMQTGVAYVMAKDPSGSTTKHLRVGINSALVNDAAIASFLIKKGIITEEEYMDEILVQLEKEVERYTQEVNRLYGANNIKLG